MGPIVIAFLIHFVPIFFGCNFLGNFNCQMPIRWDSLRRPIDRFGKSVAAVVIQSGQSISRKTPFKLSLHFLCIKTEVKIKRKQMQRQRQRQQVYRTFPAKHNKLQMQMKANDGKEESEREEGKIGRKQSVCS